MDESIGSMPPTHAYQGFITIELLLACTVGILFISGAIMVSHGIGGNTPRYTLGSGDAMTLDVDWDLTALHTLTTYSTQAKDKLMRTWHQPSDAHVLDTLRLTQSISYISPCSAHIETTASWTSTHERTRTMTHESVLTSPTIARALHNGSCDPLPPGSWRNPERVGETPSGTILGSPTSFSYIRINDVPYLIVTTTNSVQSDDLWIVDINDPLHPTVVSSLETGGQLALRGILHGTALHHGARTYAYVLEDSTTNQLQVIDITNPLAPALVHTRSFEPYGVSPLGTNPQGRVIRQYNNRLYVGLRTTIGPELLVFDITNTPTNPTFHGALPASFDHSIYDIAPSTDGFLFLAIKPGSPPSGLPTRELMVIDVRGTPRDTGGGFNATSTPNDTEGAMALYLLGNRLYMGRERVSNAAERDLYVFDVGSSTKPTYVKSGRLGIPTTSLQGTPRVLDIIVQGPHAYIATTDTTRTLRLYDIEHDAETIIPVREACVTSLSIPRLTELFYFDNTLYTLSGLLAQVGAVIDNEALCPR